MKISEVTVETVKQYACVEIDDDDRLIERVFMPAARERVAGYTGLDAEEMDRHEDLTAAYIALCAFLYDNRSMNILNDKQNMVIASFLDAHCRNLVG